MADIDKMPHGIGSLMPVAESLFLNTANAGVSKDSLLATARNYERHDQVFQSIKSLQFSDLNTVDVIDPAVMLRHMDALTRTLDEIMGLFQKTEGMKGLAFEMLRSAYSLGVSDSLLESLLAEIDFKHHEDNLRSIDFSNLKLSA
ncbi:hypothetical protein [Amycolatopsis silviterrae]|uniref:Uncharacterized protein n=1 Tax=Amycolatopsis silviterrae TaxID=1656914 RepID=A0ABW5H8W8_9PSEU